ncbi:hypothetical protein B0H19DRAFT_1074764 [Mycena capillaripes]|nr:hypothetical protein B0H19DRAFT_1074764 [Mycena capillaripes]
MFHDQCLVKDETIFLAESISGKNACCKRMEPAAKLKNKVLVVLLGESWGWKRAEETGCGSSTKTRTMSARSLLRGARPRQRCGESVRRDYWYRWGNHACGSTQEKGGGSSAKRVL